MIKSKCSTPSTRNGSDCLSLVEYFVQVEVRWRRARDLDDVVLEGGQNGESHIPDVTILISQRVNSEPILSEVFLGIEPLPRGQRFRVDLSKVAGGS